MSAFTQTLTLANGTAIPQLGFGTWMIGNADAGSAVQAALAAGYRHLDTAQDYGNEQGVGAGIRASGIAREEIFLTSKLLAQHKNYADAQAALAQSFVDLDVNYIDLMLIHAPQPWILRLVRRIWRRWMRCPPLNITAKLPPFPFTAAKSIWTGLIRRGILIGAIC